MEDEQELPVIPFERRKNPRYDNNYTYLWYKQEDLELRFSKHLENHEESIKKIMLDVVGSSQYRLIFKNMIDETTEVMVNKIIAQMTMRVVWIVLTGLLITHYPELKNLLH